jgi:hypothetical protein
MTKIVIDFSGVRQTTLGQYASRFLIGGTITALVGLIAGKFGPGIGGLFLAFPAIFPASATLIETHELQKKQRAGVKGVVRSREAAGVDAAGAALGSIGLVAFAVAIHKLITNFPVWEVLPAALLIWMAVAILVWRIYKTM